MNKTHRTKEWISIIDESNETLSLPWLREIRKYRIWIDIEESFTAKELTDNHWTSKRKRSTLGTTPSRRKVFRQLANWRKKTCSGTSAAVVQIATFSLRKRQSETHHRSLRRYPDEPHHVVRRAIQWRQMRQWHRRKLTKHQSRKLPKRQNPSLVHLAKLYLWKDENRQDHSVLDNEKWDWEAYQATIQAPGRRKERH